MRLELPAVLVLMLALSGCPAVLTGGERPEASTGGGAAAGGSSQGGGEASGGGASGGGTAVQGGGSASTGGGTGSTDGGLAISAKGSLRFKGPERFGNDLAAGLSLTPAELCNELGQYPCVTQVHGVSLGGVDPYVHGLYEAAPTTGAATSIVVDRTVLAACTARVTKDLTTPAQAVVFKNLSLTPQGKLSNIAGPEVSAAITELYHRGLLRDPTTAETATLVQLARDLEGTSSATPARGWMQAACFAVFSSAEAVFY